MAARWAIINGNVSQQPATWHKGGHDDNTQRAGKMKTTPLPDALKVDDKIVQVKYAPGELLEVFKIDDDDPERAYLMRENGVALRCSQSIKLLRDYDYRLCARETVNQGIEHHGHTRADSLSGIAWGESNEDSKL